MNFWDDRELAVRLKNNQVSSKEQLGYVLLSQLFLSISILDMMRVDVLCLLISFLITIITYRTNARGDDKDFILRYTTISFSLVLRTIVFSLLITLFFSILVFMVAKNYESISYIENKIFVVTTIIYLSISFIYNLKRLNTTMKIASGQIPYIIIEAD
jgi:hypothetical protein